MRLAIVLTALACLHAQDTRFDVRSRLVLVPATVTDARGRTGAFHRTHRLPRPGDDKEAHRLDAAQKAIDRLRDRPNARRILLLISESRDRGSETELDAVTLAAQHAGVAVYAVTYSAF